MSNLKEFIRKKLESYSKEELVEMMTNVCSAYAVAKAFSGICGVNGSLINEAVVRTDLEQIMDATSQRIDMDFPNLNKELWEKKQHLKE